MKLNGLTFNFFFLFALMALESFEGFTDLLRIALDVMKDEKFWETFNWNWKRGANGYSKENVKSQIFKRGQGHSSGEEKKLKPHFLA